MTTFYRAKEGAVEHYATKYDACFMTATGKEYRQQKGSGRSEVITRFVAEGKTIAAITAEAAQAGFDPNFVVSALFKHHDTPGGAWKITAPEGTTIEEIKKQRKERKVNPETLAKREAAKAAKEAKLKEREEAKAKAAAEKEAKAKEREDAKAQREAEKAAKAQERAAAAEAKKAENAGKKGKGKAAGGEASGGGEAEAAA